MLTGPGTTASTGARDVILVVVSLLGVACGVLGLWTYKLHKEMVRIKRVLSAVGPSTARRLEEGGTYVATGDQWLDEFRSEEEPSSF